MITEYFISDNEDQRKENINNLVNYPLSKASGWFTNIGLKTAKQSLE